MPGERQRLTPREEMELLSREVAGMIRRKFLLWCVRWGIGFGVIALITRYSEGWFWLWYVGGGIAAMSLAGIGMMYWGYRGKASGIERTLDES